MNPLLILKCPVAKNALKAEPLPPTESINPRPPPAMYIPNLESTCASAHRPSEWPTTWALRFSHRCSQASRPSPASWVIPQPFLHSWLILAIIHCQLYHNIQNTFLLCRASPMWVLSLEDWKLGNPSLFRERFPLDLIGESFFSRLENRNASLFE